MQHIEDEHQTMIFKWASIKRLSELKHNVPSGSTIFDYLVASANGGQRNAREGARLKAQGVKAGFPDIQLCLPCGGYSGLFIELKKPMIIGKAKPIISTNQKIWIDRLTKAGYVAVICYGFDDAIELITKYLRCKL